MSERKNRPKRPRRKSEGSSSSSYSTSSLSSDEEENAQDFKPIKDYLADRRELSSQLFKSVKGDKLRMMLPQVLKKMDLSELEEWCTSELSGMSKARILSILNGQPLMQSSDSDDTDDSGPSLEIISDTEEWGDLSDDDVTSKEQQELNVTSKKSKSKKDKMKTKSKSHVPKSKEKDKGKSKVKGKLKPLNEVRFDEVKVKKEGIKEEVKEKEGESLLDLLELEMRARAIRALIRKEEDIIPTAPSTQSSTSNTNSPNDIPNLRTNVRVTSKERNISLKAVEDKLEEMDQNFRASVNSKTMIKQENSGDEEDVVLVVQPTPTIELLSSGSDDEEPGTRVNQRLQNERVIQKLSMRSIVTKVTVGDRTMIDRTVTRKESEMDGLNSVEASRTDGATNKATKITDIETDKNLKEATNDVDKVISGGVNSVKDNGSSSGINKSADKHLNDGMDTSSGETTDKSTESSLFRKFKRRSQLKVTEKSLKNSTDFVTSKTANTGSDISDEKINESRDKIMEEVANTPGQIVVDRTSDKETNKSMLNTVGKISTESHDELIVRMDANEIENDTISKTTTNNGATSLSEKPLDTSFNKAIEKNLNEEEAAKETIPSGSNKIADEDKLADLEIIIDLDDYPDDMDEIENSDKVKDYKKKTTSEIRQLNGGQNRGTEEGEGKEKSAQSAETWASRYYQTEDVQSVIKESKIQSEIRKRLRERQRLARINNSPNSSASPIPTISMEAGIDKVEVKTTGSVKEYLALKCVTPADLSTSSSDSSINTVSEKSTASEKNINAVEIGKLSELTNEVYLEKSTDLITGSDLSTRTELKNNTTEIKDNSNALTDTN